MREIARLFEIHVQLETNCRVRERGSNGATLLAGVTILSEAQLQKLSQHKLLSPRRMQESPTFNPDRYVRKKLFKVMVVIDKFSLVGGI